MLNKKILMLTVILVCLISVSTVSASENVTHDIIGAENATDVVLGIDDNSQENELDASAGSFTDLANDIAKAGSTLNLNRDYNYNSKTDSKYWISIAKTMTINGNGHTINGNNQASAFSIEASNVVLNNINFINCAALDAERFTGSAVIVDYGVKNCRLSGCSFTGCSAEYDAAIAGMGKYITISDCTFKDCYANFGAGAIGLSWVNGSISGCSFENCIARDGYGGAICWYSENLALSDCSFKGCSAGLEGGAVYWYGLVGKISGCDFEDCSASGYYQEEDGYGEYVGGSGGAIYVNIGNGSIVESSFTDCSAGLDGGAVYWNWVDDERSEFGDDCTLSGCSFVNCSASGRYNEYDEFEGSCGGAVYWGWGEYDILSNCSFEDCHSKMGGAVFWSGDAGRVIESSFKGCTAEYGGGIYFNSLYCRLVNPIFNGNYAQNGPDWYSVERLVVIGKSSTLIIASDINTAYGVSNNLPVTLKDADENPLAGEQISIVLNNVEYELQTNSEGEASLAIPSNLVPNTYAAAISYAGNAKYGATSKTVDVIVDKAALRISAPKTTVEYNDGSKLVATLTHATTGKAIANANVKVKLNGVETTVKTNSKGQAKISTDGLTPGNYKATITYAGNSKYNSISKTASVVVTKTTIRIYCGTVFATLNDGRELTAILANGASGKTISNANVKVNLNGAGKTVKTDANGQAKVSTKGLAIGTYDVTFSYAGNAKYKPASTSINLIVGKADVGISAKETDGQFVATLTNTATGKAISGAKVIVKVNGVESSLKTDSSGQVSVSTEGINPKTYSATVTYAGNTKYNPASATVNIAKGKTATNLITFYNGDSSDLIATLTNAETGKALTNANVKVNINGQTTAVKTNSDGKAIFSIADLGEGTYNPTVSYGGNTKYAPSSTTAAISLGKTNMILSTAYNADKHELVVSLENSKTGNAVSGANLQVNLNGITTPVKTNSKGQTTVSTADLAPGAYDVTISYNGNAKYSPITAAVKMNV